MPKRPTLSLKLGILFLCNIIKYNLIEKDPKLEQPAEILKVLGNSHCLSVVLRLADGGKTLESLIEKTALSTSTLTYYLNRLRQRGVIVRERKGAYITYRLDAENSHLFVLLDCLTGLYGCPQSDADRLSS